MVRQAAGLVMLGLGLWLSWNGVKPVMLIMERGSDLANALFNPPTSVIRIVSAALMALGGLGVLAKIKGGGTLALIGSIFFVILGALMALSGTESSLWMDELIFGLGAIALCVLILTLRRA